MMHKTMLSVGILFVFVGICGLLAVVFYGSRIAVYDTVSTPPLTNITGDTETTMMGGNKTVYTNLMRNMMVDFSKSTYASPGERLFLTSTDNAGNELSAKLEVSGMPMQGMMSRRIACANCHGEDGKGDFVFPDGTTKSADIRWISLESEGFDSESFKTAVVDGKDEKGTALSGWMPRWKITDAQLKDLEAYLKTL